MINFSIDYLTRKDDGSVENPERSPLSTAISTLTPGPKPSSAQNETGLPSSMTSNRMSSEPDNNSDKPSHSYIALISMAILNSQEKKVLLGDIYQYIMDSFPYYNNKKKAWRNSIRHNLSLNECFIKSGRADNGKGNYWSIHSACIQDFTQGDFRRRQARRRARKSVMPEVNVSELPMSYRCNLGYVPMTSSTLSDNTNSSLNYYPSTTYQMNPAGFMYSSFNGSPASSYTQPLCNPSSYHSVSRFDRNLTW